MSRSRLVRTSSSMTMTTHQTRTDASTSAGRTLHLIDVENIAGLARPTEAEVAAALDRYRGAVTVAPWDQVVLAANRTTAASAGWVWPGVLVRAASGPDGADLALLAEADAAHVARRFDRVMIASGDHLFAERAMELRARGVRVEVVARPGSLAQSLRRVADVVRLLPDALAVAA